MLGGCGPETLSDIGEDRAGGSWGGRVWRGRRRKALSALDYMKKLRSAMRWTGSWSAFRFRCETR